MTKKELLEIIEDWVDTDICEEGVDAVNVAYDRMLNAIDEYGADQRKQGMKSIQDDLNFHTHRRANQHFSS